ncbi:hypothetical protein QBC34DRAFT_176597 [Podospora aff. communis PSN243]|uniref:Uncharacterized protein n=1 Tax=Podospora aff. communis PSN243 TaxID=3040156 RepID=A0AAV9H284_9PEZI|nr:hypothetical protein QBC34DRAFT_176597 [Podospora aff. communis PSN243]
MEFEVWASCALDGNGGETSRYRCAGPSDEVGLKAQGRADGLSNGQQREGSVENCNLCCLPPSHEALMQTKQSVSVIVCSECLLFSCRMLTSAPRTACHFPARKTTDRREVARVHQSTEVETGQGVNLALSTQCHGFIAPSPAKPQRRVTRRGEKRGLTKLGPECLRMGQPTLIRQAAGVITPPEVRMRIPPAGGRAARK